MTDTFISRNFLSADSALSRPLSSSLLTIESLAVLMGTGVDRQSLVLSYRLGRKSSRQ